MKEGLENVHHPDHYGGDTPYETIKVLEAWGLDKDFLLGNTVKYLSRAGKKGTELKDLRKALWYLNRKIATAEGRSKDFYNDIIKAMALPGAVRVKLGKPPGTEKMARPCASCSSPSMPYGTCHECGRKWGSCAEAAAEAEPPEPSCANGHHRWGIAPTTDTKCAKCKKCPGGAGVLHACYYCDEPLTEEATGHLSFNGDRYLFAAHFECEKKPLEDPDRVRLREEGKRPCDAPDCSLEATEEWEAFWLCKAHRELAPVMPVMVLDKMREAQTKIREARGKFVEARGHFAKAKQDIQEAGEGWDQEREAHRRQIADLEEKLVAARAKAHRLDLYISESEARNEQQAMDQAAELSKLHERIIHQDSLLFSASEIVEKAYGICRASTEIRAMGSEALTIRPMASGAMLCLGCHGKSVQHTCGKSPDASRCERCFARLSTNVHDCVSMGTSPDHYVTFLEGELQGLRTSLVEEFGVAPANGAVSEALRLIRELKGQGAADRLINGPRLSGHQTPHQLRVEEMMRGFGQEVPGKPLEDAPDELRVLRARLIMEECLETIQEGLRVSVTQRGDGINFDHLAFQAMQGPVNMVEFADGCADVSVVTIGSLSAFGIKDAPLLREVDANNQAKVDTGRKDEHGKWIKHPDHKGPDIARVLNEQGWGYQGKAGMGDGSELGEKQQAF